MDKLKQKQLKLTACKVRKGIIESVYSAKSGHPGGSLSIADVLTYLYFNKMNINPNEPDMENRDRFVLSKGHASPAIYSVLAHRGFFDVETLKTFRKIGSILQGHPDKKHIPGIDMSSGSLGQGISAATGMALSAKHFKNDYRVYTIVGDGESEEGQVWEAAMFAAAKKLNNLTAFIDFNGLQIDGTIAEVNDPSPLDEKFAAFGWNVIVIDGHNFEEIDNAVTEAEKVTDKPTAIIMKTVKGKGVSFMENNVAWHGAAPNAEQYEIAMQDLDKIYASIEAE